MAKEYEVVRRLFATIANDATIERATYYHDPKYTVKITRQRKPDRRERQETYILTIGVPNYAERAFIKDCKKAGEPFPVRDFQLKRYPAKAARR